MSKVMVACFAHSLDGYCAGPDQSLEAPLGVNGPEMFEWFFATRVFQRMHGQPDAGETGIDNDMAERSFVNVGAWILGRNMFGPIRGPWLNHDWKGWWGEEPPYHVPTYVLTHHARDPQPMKGGTTFHFVTGGIHDALARARDAAGTKNIRIGGGVATVRQFMQAQLIDEMHLATRPVLLGRGESLWQGLDARALGYEVAETILGERATHMILRRKRGSQ
jgi:dihydrofolate reductase